MPPIGSCGELRCGIENRTNLTHRHVWRMRRAGIGVPTSTKRAAYCTHSGATPLTHLQTTHGLRNIRIKLLLPGGVRAE